MKRTPLKPKPPWEGGKPLTRKKGLEPGSGISRTGSSTAKAKPRKRLNPMSAKRKALLPERRAIREQVFRRDGYRCQLAHLQHMTGSCMGGLTPHHKRKESQGGAYTLENLVTLCVYHNCVWVETHRAEAKALGLHLCAEDVA